MKGRLPNILAVGFLLSGCATNPSRPLADPSRASEVVVIHKDSIICGADFLGKVTVDGYVVANLFPGKYVRLKLDPGIHRIGTTDGSAPVNLEADRHYIFLVTAGYRGTFTTEQIYGAAAAKILSTSKAAVLK
jgi:hypothetical protein